jgi:hypothetical protein
VRLLVLLPLHIVILLVFFCLFCHLSVVLGVNGAAAALLLLLRFLFGFRTVFVLLSLMMLPRARR